MESIIMDAAVKQGIWTALFVFLLIYVLYDSRRREAKYQETIKMLGDEILRDVRELKERLRK